MWAPPPFDELLMQRVYHCPSFRSLRETIHQDFGILAARPFNPDPVRCVQLGKKELGIRVLGVRIARLGQELGIGVAVVRCTSVVGELGIEVVLVRLATVRCDKDRRAQPEWLFYF